METSGGAAALPDVSRFFEEAWRLFRARVWRLLTIGGVGSMAALAAALVPIAAGGAVSLTSNVSPALVWTLAGVSSASILLWLISWVQASMLECALAEESDAGAWACCKRAWPKTAAFSWVCVLYALLVVGGFCAFGLPGVFLSVALLFAPLACVRDGAAGLDALKRSVDDTAGNFFPLALRLALTGLATSLPGFVPVIGWLISAVTGPFSLVALAVLYKQLEARGPARPSGRGWVLGLAAAGLALPVVIGIKVVPEVIARAPQMLAAAESAARTPPDPEKLQKVLAALQGDSSALEQVSTAVELATSASTTTVAASTMTAVVPAR